MSDLPEVGELYLVETWLYGGDPKPTRPAVVVKAPRSRLDVVHIITRTSDTTEDGERHEAVTAMELTLPGVFSLQYYRRVEAARFHPPSVHRLGVLDPDCLERVVM